MSGLNRVVTSPGGFRSCWSHASGRVRFEPGCDQAVCIQSLTSAGPPGVSGLNRVVTWSGIGRFVSWCLPPGVSGLNRVVTALAISHFIISGGASGRVRFEPGCDFTPLPGDVLVQPPGMSGLNWGVLFGWLQLG